VYGHILFGNRRLRSLYLTDLFDIVKQALHLRELDPRIATQVGGMLQESGFQNVTDNRHKIPIGRNLATYTFFQSTSVANVVSS
jgi:hypothetical protein